MEPMMNEENKSRVASFIPYRRNGDGWEFFLQKRTADAPTSPGLVGIFGGGVETGETVEEGLFREIEEELTYKPSHLCYFSKYEFATSCKYVYIEEVGADFEKTVNVKEGDYGEFMSDIESADLRLFTRTVRVAIPELVEMLSKK